MPTYYVANTPVSDELYHHGIQGQKWGIRRYQNPDGSLTEEGRKRYNANVNKVIDAQAKVMDRHYKETYYDGDLYRLTKKKAGSANIRTLDTLEKGKRKEYHTTELEEDAVKKRLAFEKNRNPFKSIKLKKESDSAREKSYKAGESFSYDFLDAAMSEIKKMPKDQQVYAEAYCYHLIGLDW